MTTTPSSSPGTTRTIHLPPGLFLYIRVIISSVFFVSGLYKLAYLDLDTLFASHYVEDSNVSMSALANKPLAEFWPGVPCASRLDEALRSYLLLSPVSLARVRPWYPVAFSAGAICELAGAVLFVKGERSGARLLTAVLGVVTLVMHPVWDEEARFDALRNASLAGGLFLSDVVMRS